MNRLTVLGLGITAIWALALGTVIYFKYADADVMSLNEWGDFLAGTSAPLALLWLVIGYFQHGAELKLNTKALKMQEEELRRQVEETARLVEATKDQADAATQVLQDGRQRDARDATPEFVEHGGSFSGDKAKINLRNRGGVARNIELHYDGPHEINFSPQELVETEENFNFKISYNEPKSLINPIRFGISCVDRLGNIHHTKFELTADNLLKIIHEEPAATRR